MYRNHLIVRFICRTVGGDQLFGQWRQRAVDRLLRRVGQHDVRREQPRGVQKLRRRHENGKHTQIVGRTRLDPVGAHLPDPVERVLGQRQFPRRPNGRTRHIGQTHR